MENAMAAGQRGVARVWMDCMYGLIREREAMRVVGDIEQLTGR